MPNRRMTILVGVVLLIAGLRLARVASECESGWSFVLTQWQDASLGLISLGHTSIGHSAPSEQADFWLSEIDRIVRDHPDSASIHMGAAWILDSPEIGFMQNHWRQSKHALMFPQSGLELDEEAISDAKAEFRDKCVDRCLEMARTATQLDATDVRWWRMRALLLFEGDTLYSGVEFEPRREDWLTILDECKRHDPENALYDYLAALQLWNTSASYDWPAASAGQLAGAPRIFGTYENNVDEDSTDESDEDDESWILTIRDPDEFAVGLERFLAAQQLPFLAIGEAGYPSVPDFLEHSRLRKTDQVEFAVSRLVTPRQSTLFLRLWRWQTVRADDARKAGDRQREMDILQQSLRFYDQAISPAETSALSTLTKFGGLRRHAYEQVVNLQTTEPATIEAGELEAIQLREEDLRIATATLERALWTLDGTNPKEYSASWDAVVSTVTSISSAVLLIVAGVFLLLGRILGPHTEERPRLGIVRHLLVWAVACGMTFVVLGMAPAEMISHEVQRLAIVSGIWLSAIGITVAAVWFVVRSMRLRKFRFRLATLFAVMTGVAVFSALWPLMSALFVELAKHPPELWIPAKGWSGLDAEVLRNAMRLEEGTWYWAVMQWFAHGGQYVGLIAALLLTIAWYAWRSAREVNQRILNYWTREIRARWGDLFRFVGRSAFGAALCWLFLYVIVAPSAIQLSETEFQHKMRYCRNPEAHWTEIRNAQAEVTASVERIAAIREQVQFELFGEGVIEKDFSRD